MEPETEKTEATPVQASGTRELQKQTTHVSPDGSPEEKGGAIYSIARAPLYETPSRTSEATHHPPVAPGATGAEQGHPETPLMQNPQPEMFHSPNAGAQQGRPDAFHTPSADVREQGRTMELKEAASESLKRKAAPQGTQDVSFSPRKLKRHPLTADHTSAWKDREVPNTDAMLFLLRMAHAVEESWTAQPRWISKVFKRSFHPDSLEVGPNGVYQFSNSFLKVLKAQQQFDTKDIRMAKKCSEMFQGRDMQRVSAVILQGTQSIESEKNFGMNLLVSSDVQELNRDSFVFDALNVICKHTQKPLKTDVTLGGRDLGGVYTELTVPAAKTLCKELYELNLLEPGTMVREMGSGLGTMSFIFSFLYDCYTVGVEIEPTRIKYGLRHILELKSLWDSDPMVALRKKAKYQSYPIKGFEDQNRQIQMGVKIAKQKLDALAGRVRFVLEDARNVPLDGVGVFNCFDEALNTDDVWDLMMAWLLSSSRCMVGFKCCKLPSLLKSLLEEARERKIVVEVAKKVPLKKYGGGGQSTAVVLIKGKLDELKGKPKSAKSGALPSMTSMRPPAYLDTKGLDPEKETQLMPITEDGWRAKDWVEAYKHSVVEPTCAGLSLRLIKRSTKNPMTEPCYSSIFIKCDSKMPGIGCNCAKVLTPLKNEATRVMNSPIAGKGLFATMDVAKGQLLMHYSGKPCNRGDKPEDCTYVADAGNFYIDARSETGEMGKHAFVNHSCEPNSELREILSLDGSSGGSTLVISSIKDIKAGDEITMEYGDGSAQELFGSKSCLCGSPKCRLESNRLLLFFNIYNCRSFSIASGQKETTKKVLQMAQAKAIEQQDGRDLYRTELLRQRTQAGVYGVSKDTHLKPVDPDFHIDCDVAKPKKMKQLLQKFGVKFSHVYADWMWWPLSYWRERVKQTFFTKTLVVLSQEGIIRKNASVFLPFNPWVLECLSVPEVWNHSNQDQNLLSHYQASFLETDQLAEHELWQCTEGCDRLEFHNAFGKSIDESTKNYLTHSKSSFIEGLTDAGRERTLKEIDSIDRHHRFDRVRFIKLVANPGYRVQLFSYPIQEDNR